MKKKQFMKIITEVVRREVKKEVQKILINEETSHQLTDIIPEVSEPKQKVEYTKNKSLNDVLNETVGLTKSEPATWEVEPSSRTSTRDSARNTRANQPSRIVRSLLPTHRV